MEGTLKNKSYRQFFTDYFGLTLSFYNNKSILGNVHLLTVGGRRVVILENSENFCRPLNPQQYRYKMIFSTPLQVTMLFLTLPSPSIINEHCLRFGLWPKRKFGMGYICPEACLCGPPVRRLYVTWSSQSCGSLHTGVNRKIQILTSCLKSIRFKYFFPYLY